MGIIYLVNLIGQQICVEEGGAPLENLKTLCRVCTQKTTHFTRVKR